MAELFRGMAAAGSMRASESEMAAVARNVVLVATYWMSFHRLSHAARAAADDIDVGLGVYQVLALIAPFLVGDARALLDRLGRDYL
jgi:hypothetical protein